MKKLRMIWVVLVTILAVSAVHVRGQDEMDENGTPMKLYPPGYDKAEQQALLQANSTAKVSVKTSSIRARANFQDQASPNGGPVPVPQYTVIDLGTLGGNYSQAYGINDNGQVVGHSGTGSYDDAFLYSYGAMQNLGVGTTGGSASLAYGINNNGEVVGNIWFSPGTQHAFLWSNGSMQDLNSAFGGYYNAQNYAYGINSSGKVTGSYVYGYGWHGFLYTSGPIQDMVSSLGGASCEPYAINDNGQVTGGAYIDGSVSHAFLWSNGSMQDLGTIPGYANSDGLSVNAAGQVVGYIGTQGILIHAFLWSGGSMQDLGTLGGSNSTAWGINANGQVVGQSDVIGGGIHAFLYSGGVMQDLNSLVVGQTSGWTLQIARAINSSGQIAGYGISPSGQTHAFRLDPLPTGSVTASSTPQTALPTYGNSPAPTGNEDSLVFVTHGWIPATDDPYVDTAWVDQMAGSIGQYLVNNNVSGWHIESYLWLAKAQPKDSLAYRDLPYAAQEALVAGQQEGIIVGNQIASQGWANVHLIAHSAGAGLIEAAAERIKTLSPNTVVQCTFLDAYGGNDKAGYANYGKAAKWSDSYFSRDIETGSLTEGALANAYNVDVTQLDTSDQFRLALYLPVPGQVVDLGNCYKTESTHGWPRTFYANTIAGGVPSSYGNFGWPLSLETGGFNAARTAYPVGNNPSQVLGTPDPSCSEGLVYSAVANGVTGIDFLGSFIAQSTTGAIQKFYNYAAQLFSGSPVWISTVVTVTNYADNLISFDAKFTSAAGAHGLLSVYWDTNMIGLIDEAAVQPGLQHYAMSFPTVGANASHVVGFHLDPFTSTQSSILLTNVVLGQSGIGHPPSLAVTTNTSNGLLVYQLNGEPANYMAQVSTDLINWTSIAYLANTNGSVNFIDPASTNHPQCGFYRAVSVP